MRLRFSIVTKLTLLCVALVLTTALAVNEVYVRGGNQILVDDAVHALEQETDNFKYPLDSFIGNLKEDARLLAQLPETRIMMDAPDAASLDTLAGVMTEVVRTTDQYRDIEIVSARDGQEILKVERFGNRIERIPDAKLASESGRADVQAGLLLNPGDVYLSQPALDRDQGRIIEPHVAVMRAVIPLYTSGKDLFGLVVINMDFGMILRDIQRNLLQDRILYITDATGNFLLHPDAAKLYAGDLGTDHRIQDMEPRLVTLMGNAKQDRATFLPDNLAQGNIFTFEKYHYDTLHPDSYLGIAVEAPYQDVIGKTVELEHRGFLFSAGIAAVAMAAAILLLLRLIRPLNQVADAVIRYRKGEKDIVLPTDSPDEIGVLSREFETMFRQKNDEDWVKENLVGISRALLGFKDVATFSNRLMEALALATNAQIGVLYLSNQFGRRTAKHDTEILELTGASGYLPANDVPQVFHWGEGLVGQCARDRTSRLVTDVPDDYYLHIKSALGQAKPHTILLVPILFESRLVGVMEMASLTGFSAIQRSFLDQIGFNVGVIVNSINAGMQTEYLLEEARATAEELQRSEEELKTQQEELQAANEEMEEKNRALEEQNAQIRQQAAALDENRRVIEGKASELERSNKYKSEFLANMSHELRTPLNSLLILARSLAGNEEGNLTGEQVEEAQIIHNGGLELLGLINDILDLSKVEAGKLTVINDDAAPRDIARKLEQQFDPVAREKGVAFRIELAGDSPRTLYTDSQRVEQILKNLLSNAFKFTESGSVTLAVKTPRAGTVAFSVTDTGIGIDETKLRDIFEAFQQEDGSTDRHYGGTGLGLTIARKFAHMLGGEIQVQSAKGQGSTFTLMLPTAQEPAGTEIPDRPEQETLPQGILHDFIPDDRKTIHAGDKVLLIIEDDRDFATTLMKIARRRGYKCLAAGDGKSGIVLAAEQPVTAIILDLSLPDMDGLAVLDQLKHDLRTRPIPVHIISGRDAGDLIVPMRKGAIGFLSKPVSSTDIDGAFSRIDDILDAGAKKILVIEDDRKSRTAIQSLLKKKDIEITFAGTGHAAQDMVRRARFDCIILDLRLPDMTGFDWLDSMEAEAGGQGLPPVIVYTAVALTEEENRKLNRHTGSIVIKGAHSSDRLLDEVTLFLHSVESTLSAEQQSIIRMQHDPDKMLQGRTVLLVDDDLRNTFALSKILKKHGLQVIAADNGQMALDKLDAEKSIELVIMDIMMPVMDGYQAMRAIRAKPAFRALPVIALTARAMPEEQEQCMAAGANDYLMKPVDIERLLTLLRVWLFRQESAA
jgi:CheY-like chemotaxis protein